MNILFFWPFTNEIITPNITETYEFYTQLKSMDNINLVNSYEEADYIIYMMHFRNMVNLPYDDYNKENIDRFNVDLINKMMESKNPEKDIIIDYNDWIDTRGVPDDKLMSVGKYFKRSVVKKEHGTSKELVKYPREIIPISYGIRSDFIKYDKKFKFEGYNYDICCMFDLHSNYEQADSRSIIPHIVNAYQGKKYIGRVDCPDRYGIVNTEYFKILKTSKIIVTANPPNWEGDYRLWEALLMGNLVLCDKMLLPSKIKYPLENKKHLVYYSSPLELEHLINYYMDNETERNKIGKEGRDYCLKYHKFSDRVLEVVSELPSINRNNILYDEYLNIVNNWPLDDWSINCECFKKIVEILEFGKTILELGSGKSSELLNKFYNVISVEDNKDWLNKYNTQYIHVNSISNQGYDINELSKKIKDIDYQLLIVDGPNDNRENIVNHIDIIKKDVPIIWDDTQVYEEYAIQMSNSLNKSYTTYQCKPQAPWFWGNHILPDGTKCGGKRFTLII